MVWLGLGIGVIRVKKNCNLHFLCTLGTYMYRTLVKCISIFIYYETNCNFNPHNFILVIIVTV